MAFSRAERYGWAARRLTPLNALVRSKEAMGKACMLPHGAA